MPIAAINQEKIFLKEPKIEAGLALRILFRVAAYCLYILVLFGAITAVISQIDWLRWAGALGMIFLADRILHAKQARRSLSEISYEDGKINAADYFSPKTIYIFEKALDKAVIGNYDFYLSLLGILAKEKDMETGLTRMDVPIKEFQSKAGEFLNQSKISEKVSRDGLHLKAETLAANAFINAAGAGEKYIEPRAVFSALINVQNEKLSRLFSLFSIGQGDMENALVFSRFHDFFSWLRKPPAAVGGFVAKPSKIRHRTMNRAWTARPTPTLDKYSMDLTDLAREEEIGFLIGHEKEYSQLVDILARPSKPNALLIGEPGSGKETLVAHLAFEIIKDETPEALFDKRLVCLEIGRMISGAAPDEVSKRVNQITNEIKAAGNIILYIPDIHNLVKTSGMNFMSAADVFIPIITGDEFPVVGATFPREFKQMIDTQTDFASAFDQIRVEEISEDNAVKILTYESVILERQYGLIISFGAIKQSVFLAHKYFRQKLLPGSAEDLLKESLSDASQKKSEILGTDDVIAIAERKINIPIHRAGKAEAERLLNLESIIHERMIDQEEAVESVSKALREYRSGLSRKGGPIAVFLFVGPTGVGKTELAKILSKIHFGSEQMMIRFDMSEYQDKQSVFRFIGSPDGKMAGNLTESVIQKPYSLILLDEFEKAYPDILNLFLQVFDDGRLTDNTGRTIDFTNTIIIATSNAHSDFIKSHIEARTPMQVISDELKKKLTDYFRPELLNRFSDIIVFKTLSLPDIQAITQIQLKDLSKNLSETNGINLVIDDAVVKKTGELGFDPVFGGRPLRGVISDKIRSVLAEKILKGEIMKGSEVEISLGDNGEFEFEQK
ncbi:MAG: ATP-dependent Clp protease ATP-binding subunit [Candidatus Wolfebacteria bacterium]|nr:ATP-dependent Clp protease ATP-binding subunit [Candidatus Wolfebacteria bacterium]